MITHPHLPARGNCVPTAHQPEGWQGQGAQHEDGDDDETPHRVGDDNINVKAVEVLNTLVLPNCVTSCQEKCHQQPAKSNLKQDKT